MGKVKVMELYEVQIQAIFKTLVAMENNGVITHNQVLQYADISEEEYVNLALTVFDKNGQKEDEHTSWTDRAEYVEDDGKGCVRILGENYEMIVGSLDRLTLHMTVLDNHYGNELYQESVTVESLEDVNSAIESWIARADETVKKVIKIS